MSVSGSDIVTIPARLTANQLAAAIDREYTDVAAVLSARGQPDGEDDIIDGELAVEVAGALGVEVVVEPRDLALEHLYTFETVGELGSEPGGRTARLVFGVTERVEELDASIEEAAEHWSVARMPVVDRNILRMGLYELQEETATPTAVIVSEAVRLAQTYSTERSGSFVNGVLAALAKQVRG